MDDQSRASLTPSSSPSQHLLRTFPLLPTFLLFTLPHPSPSLPSTLSLPYDPSHTHPSSHSCSHPYHQPFLLTLTLTPVPSLTPVPLSPPSTLSLPHPVPPSTLSLPHPVPPSTLSLPHPCPLPYHVPSLTLSLPQPYPSLTPVPSLTMSPPSPLFPRSSLSRPYIHT